jgi:CTP:molybdopterin cytidylyltransferase MocA
MKLMAVVLAAGEGRRVGGPKALLPVEGRSFLARACSLLARPGVTTVVVVLGAEAERVRAEAGVPEGTVVVENEGWRDGMLSSVWRGLEAAEARGADGILLHPVDHPLIAPETVDGVVAALRGGAFAAVPVHSGRRGHPGGFAREAFAALRAAPLDQGARAVLARYRERVVEVVGDPGCLLGVNTRQDHLRGTGR